MKWKTVNIDTLARCAVWASLALVVLSGLLGSAAVCDAAEAAADAQVNAAPQAIQRLIEQLGSDEFLVRQRAERELLRFGFAAYDALTDAGHHIDLEIAARARYLARQIQVQWVLPTDSAQVKDILRDYGQRSETQRLAKVAELLEIPNYAGWEAICRVVLYDQSRSVAKQTAAVLLDKYREEDAWRTETDVIRKLLGGSRRDAAAWLVTRVRSLDDAPAAIQEWSDHIAANRRDLGGSGDELSANLTLTLIRQKFVLLNRMDRRDEAIEALRGMIALERGDPKRLAQIMTWLAEEKAWVLIDELADRFERVFAQNVKLLYHLAEALNSKGDHSRADATAKRALAMGPESSHNHYVLASYLRGRGLRSWAEAEYRRAIEIGPIAESYAIFAAVQLSDMLHDGGRELAAAEVLKSLLEGVEKNKTVKRILAAGGRTLPHLRGNMEFFFSQYEHGRGNWDKEREYLDRAIKADPSNADVLIAMHRTPEASDKYRKSTANRIDRTTDSFRQQIVDDPDSAKGYNQLAWLIANTTGDFDEAVRCSHKSLELSPGAAAFLDTLGHCYYAKKDYKNAVKYQQQAADLEPNMFLITRQLEVFKRALKDSQAEAEAEAEAKTDGTVPENSPRGEEAAP